MGIYVSKPVTEKDSCDEEYKFIKCGSSSMQGWRTAQEDAHNAILDFDKDSSFFAVYDGHGGHEVAEYSAAHLPQHLLNNTMYKNGNFKQALVDVFLAYDVHLLRAEAMSELKRMAGNKKSGEESSCTDSDDSEEVTALRREADMPIDEVLASNYSEMHTSASRLQENDPAAASSPSLRPKRDRQAASAKSLLDDDTPLDHCTELNTDSNSSNSSESLKTESINLLVKKEDSPKLLSSSKSSDIKLDSNGEVTRPSDVVVNGNMEQSSVESECCDKRTDSDVKVNGDVKEHCDSKDDLASNGDAGAEVLENKTQLVVEGRRIVPTTLSTTISAVSKDGEVIDDAPSYTGKGKSGGKGGKVKGASAITTTTTQDSPLKTGRARRTPLPDTRRMLLSGDDLDSEEDEDEEDETFAIDGAEDDLDEEGDSSDEEEEEEEENDEAAGASCEAAEDCEEEEDSDNEEGGPWSTEDIDVYNEFSATMRDGPGFDSGCTACIALLHKSTLLCANVGDSRCVVSRAGKAIEMSLDHKPEDQIETDRITKAGGKVTADGRVNGGLNLSRAFGDHGYKQNKDLSAAEQMISPLPDVKVLNLCQEDDFVIIACDGIWNSLTSQQAVDFVAERLSEDPDLQLSSICAQMFEHCLAPNLDGDGTGCDNMTCIIFSFKDKAAFPQTASDEPEIFEIPTPPDTKAQSLGEPGVVTSANGSQLNGSSSSLSPAEQTEDSAHKQDTKVEDEGAESGEETDVAVKEEGTGSINGSPGVESQKSAVKRAAEKADQSSLADDRPGKKAKLDLSSAV